MGSKTFKTKDFRIYNNKYYIRLKEFKKSLMNCVAETSEEADEMIQFLIYTGRAEIRKDIINGKDYITVDEGYVTAHEIF